MTKMVTKANTASLDQGWLGSAVSKGRVSGNGQPTGSYRRLGASLRAVCSTAT
jgi:hypothetical protein